MATIKDVAQKVGVTVTTVSRVLNNRGYISEETRQKVYRVMEELDYQPNEIARSLFRRKSNIIGLIIPTVSHPFFGEFVSYLEYYAYNSGYKILLCNSHRERVKEREYIEMLKRNQVDGIIMGSQTLEIDEYVNLNMPLVTFDRRISNNVPFVSSDNYEGGRLATNLLIDKGCRKIANICGNLDLDMLSNKRHDAFIDTAVSRNVEYLTVQTSLDGFDIDQYERIVCELFEQHPDIDGIFTSSDMIAAQVLKVCHKFNKKIPDNLKVIGYDDIKFASMFIPQISTIKQPIEEISRLVIELITKQINGEDVSKQNFLPVTLIERSTT